jgi:hypothetical protein
VVRTFLTALAGAALVGWLAFAPICWVLRDGLGPNSHESHGRVAVGRFLTNFGWGPVAAVLTPLTAADLAWTARLYGPEADDDPGERGGPLPDEPQAPAGVTAAGRAPADGNARRADLFAGGEAAAPLPRGERPAARVAPRPRLAGIATVLMAAPPS